MTAPDPLMARADRIFDAALDLEPARRAAFVDQECAGDPDLRALVDRLLAFLDDEVGGDDDLVPGGALHGALASALEDDLSDPGLPASVRQIGDYQVLRELGRGGTAFVFLARDREGQQVAVKLLRPGATTGDLLDRFLQESKILRELGAHPHIAHLLDGGRDGHGRPFFVMEYVEGKAIDEYCDANHLALDERLRLLIKVARAVGHAHDRMVIHRDVKPSNVLVGPDGEPKLLDFGISKLLDPESTSVPLTRSGTQLMTPAYATPEQLLGQPVAPTTDVYQLGLLLYVLVCGRLPYKMEAHAAGVAGAIIEAMPRPPAKALFEPDPEMPIPISGRWPARRIATARGSLEPEELARRLEGDIERIALTALAKDPDERYVTVGNLVDDLERLLAGRPVRAPGDNTRSLGKLLRKIRQGFNKP